MSKDVISIKSNGIRNELKEIRNSIDALTNALIEIFSHFYIFYIHIYYPILFVLIL